MSAAERPIPILEEPMAKRSHQTIEAEEDLADDLNGGR